MSGQQIANGNSSTSTTKKRGGLFRRVRGRRSGGSSNGHGNDDDDDSQSQYTTNGDASEGGDTTGTATATARRRKGGLAGRMIRGLVGRRRKRRSHGGDGGDDGDFSVEGSESSSSYAGDRLYGQGDGGPPSSNGNGPGQGNGMPHSPLEQHTLAQVIEEEEDDYEEDDEDDDEDDDVVDRDGAPRALPNKAMANRMISKKARELPHDNVSDAELAGAGSFASATSPPPPTATAASASAAAPLSGPESLAGAPLALVLLLVDPLSLRFELLQLTFDAPQEATVRDVLDQAGKSVKEPKVRDTRFVGLVDRTGRGHGGKAPLRVAAPGRLTCGTKDAHRDVLVGIPAKAGAEGTAKLARPILCDPKVIAMLESNGYPMDGWTQDRKREATTLLDGQQQASNNEQRRGRSFWGALMKGLLLLLLLLLAIAVGVTVVGTGELPPISTILESLGGGTERFGGGGAGGVTPSEGLTGVMTSENKTAAAGTADTNRAGTHASSPGANSTTTLGGGGGGTEATAVEL